MNGCASTAELIRRTDRWEWLVLLAVWSEGVSRRNSLLTGKMQGILRVSCTRSGFFTRQLAKFIP
jgi:hypothetical protein